MLSLLTHGLSFLFLFVLYRSKPPLSKPITESHSGETLLIGESLLQQGSFSRLRSRSPVGLSEGVCSSLVVFDQPVAASP